MRGVNKVNLRGHMGADPDMYHGDGFSIANVRLATTNKYTKKDGEEVEETTWHSLVFRNKLAEIVESYLTKGSHIEVYGSIKQDQWEDDDGVTRYTTKIVVNELYIVSTPRDDDGTEDGGGNAKASGSPKANKAPRAKSAGRPKASKKSVSKSNDELPY